MVWSNRLAGYPEKKKSRVGFRVARSGVLKGLEVTIVEINKALELKPELINQDPRRGMADSGRVLELGKLIARSCSIQRRPSRRCSNRQSRSSSCGRSAESVWEPCGGAPSRPDCPGFRGMITKNKSRFAASEDS